MKKVLVAIGIVVFLTTALVSTSFAASYSTNSYSTNSYSGGGFLLGVQISGNKVQGIAKISLTAGDEAIITLKLQKQTSSGGWTTVATRPMTIREERAYPTIEATATSGTYRMSAIIRVYDATGKTVESTTQYSDTVKY